MTFKISTYFSLKDEGNTLSEHASAEADVMKKINDEVWGMLEIINVHIDENLLFHFDCDTLWLAYFSLNGFLAIDI